MPIKPNEDVVNARGAPTGNLVCEVSTDIIRVNISVATPLALSLALREPIQQGVCVEAVLCKPGGNVSIVQCTGLLGSRYVECLCIPSLPVESRYQIVDTSARDFGSYVSIVKIKYCLSDRLYAVSEESLQANDIRTALMSSRAGTQDNRVLAIVESLTK